MLCPSCGRDNRPVAEFCDGCGAKLAAPVPDPAELPSRPDYVLRAAGSTTGGFIGRQREMGELQVALEDALSGQGRLVMLVGEPGIGKTRTAQELAALAEQRGAQVLWGWCYEEEGAPPYWPWMQPIRSYVEQKDPEALQSEMGPGAADIAELIPEVGVKLPHLEPPPSLELEQARFRLFNSITSFLKGACQAQPLVFVIDDLHWADRSSLLMLEFLAQEIRASRLLLVGSYRDVEVTSRDPLSQTLGNLIRQPHFTKIQLQGLTQQEVGEFVEASGGFTLRGGSLEILHKRTEGNPLFVGEIMRLFSPEQISENRAWVDTIPEGIRDAIGRRLSRLSEPSNQVLRTASVIGREFDFRLLNGLNTEINEDLLLEALEGALESHLIHALPQGQERYQFSHALIQQALCEELSPSRKVRLHARIAETLELMYGADVEQHAAELAYHYGEAASVTGVRKLVRYSLLAGERALAGYAWDEAKLHFERGTRAKGVSADGTESASDAEEAELLFGLGRSQAATTEPHQIQDAITTMGRVFDYYAQAGDVDRAIAVAEYPFYTLPGQRTGVTPLIARALTLAPPESLPAGRLLSRYGWVLGLQEGDYEGAREASARALAIAQAEGDIALEIGTLAGASEVDGNYLQWRDSLEKSRRAVDLCRSVDGPQVEASARFFAAIGAWYLGDREEMRQQAEAMLSSAERLRDRFLLTSALWFNEVALSFEGDWQSARNLSDRAMAVSPLDPRAIYSRALLEFEVGEFDEGNSCVERLLELSSLAPRDAVFAPAEVSMVIPIAARITGVLGRSEVAEAAAQTVLSSPSATPLFSMMARAGLALQAVQRGDVAAAAEQYACLESARGIMLMLRHMPGDAVLGHLARTIGDLDKSVAHFEDAVAFCHNASYRPELAWNCCYCADTLLDRGAPGDCEKATSLLNDSLALSSELGMRPLTKRVLVLQERAESQPKPAPAYPNNLTQREVEVLRLITTGKTDREIAEELLISVKTVGNHVSNLLKKTGVANRTEAATYASRQGLI